MRKLHATNTREKVQKYIFNPERSRETHAPSDIRSHFVNWLNDEMKDIGQILDSKILEIILSYG